MRRNSRYVNAINILALGNRLNFDDFKMVYKSNRFNDFLQRTDNYIDICHPYETSFMNLLMNQPLLKKLLERYHNKTLDIIDNEL